MTPTIPSNRRLLLAAFLIIFLAKPLAKVNDLLEWAVLKTLGVKTLEEAKVLLEGQSRVRKEVQKLPDPKLVDQEWRT